MNEIQAQPDFHVYGHDWAVAQLRRGLINGRMRHAYLFVGVESVGKMTLARYMAMALNCLDPDISARPCGVCSSCRRVLSGNHPDIITAQRESDTAALKIEEVRNVTNKLALKPYEARYRIAIFPDFDAAQPRAQDALLKTLEEPPRHAVLILLAPALENILPTITSRSQVLHLRPAAISTTAAVLRDHFGADDDRAALLARLSGGRVGWAIQVLQQPDLLDQRLQALDLLESLIVANRAERFNTAADLARDKGALITLLDMWQVYWRDVLLLAHGDFPPTNADRTDRLRRLANRVGADGALAALRATRTLLDTLETNANVRLALEVMFLDYPNV